MNQIDPIFQKKIFDKKNSSRLSRTQPLLRGPLQTMREYESLNKQNEISLLNDKEKIPRHKFYLEKNKDYFLIT